MGDEQLRAAQEDALNLVHQVYDLKRQAELIADLPEEHRRIANDPGLANWEPKVAERVRALIDQFGKSLQELRSRVSCSSDARPSTCPAGRIEAVLRHLDESIPSELRERLKIGERTEFSATETLLRAVEDICRIPPDGTWPPEHKEVWEMLAGWNLPSQKMTEAAIRDDFKAAGLNDAPSTLVESSHKQAETISESQGADGTPDQQSAPSQQQVDTELLQRFAEMTPDGEVALQIARIVSDTSMSREKRASRACELNPQLYQKDSSWWAERFNISRQAVEKWTFWKVDRKEFLERFKEEEAEFLRQRAD